MDINTLVDNIILSHDAAEDSKCARRSAVANEALDIIVPFLITAALVAVVFIVASI